MDNRHPDFRISVLVNRKRVIATLEDKANVTGFQWTLPETIPPGFVEKRNAKGNFLYYTLTEPVTIRDVDGRNKQTIKTTFYEADKRTLKDTPKPAFGVHIEGLAGAYHGKLSRHWKQEHLTLSAIIDNLISGFAIAPGLFNSPKNASFRSGNYCEHRQIILFDADEWTEAHPAPLNLDNFLTRYPTLINDFYWIGESISSRTSLKPEFRARLMLVLPEPIGKGDDSLWETAIDAIVTKYPFIARGVGIDKVRLSFGNARPECENRVLDSFLSSEIFGQWKQIASEKQAKAETDRIEADHKKTEREAHRTQKNALKTKLAKRGYAVEDNKDPIRVFCEVNAETLLIDNGLASRLSGNSWNWSESSQGRSFELENGIIKPFSNTMQTASPETDGTKPVNAHRFILYYLHNLDLTNDSDKHALRCILADLNYGTHPETYQKQQDRLYEIAKNEGLDIPKRTRKWVKLHKRTDIDCVLEPLEKTRDVLVKAFKKGKRLVGLRADTGVGKTKEALNFFLKGIPGWFSTPTTDLSKEVFTRFNDAEIDVFRWRGVASEPDGEFPHEKPCMFPDEYIAYAESGRNAYRLLCERCQYRDECEEYGYRSQAEKSKASQVTVAAHKDLLMNPNFRATAKRVLPTHKEDLIVIDEFDIFTSFVEIHVTQKRLEYLRDTWHDHLLGALAKRFLQLCFVEGTPYKICDEVLDLNDEESHEVIQALSSLRIGDTIRDWDAAHEYEAELPAPSVDEIKARPRIETEDWNLLIQLKLFADIYRHAETAPMTFKDNTLTFYLPPLPIPPEKIKARILCMSATLNETFFRQVFKARQEKRGDVDFIDAADTEWDPNAGVWQLQTNRNPRRTLLIGDKDEKGKWRYTGELSDTGQKYLQRITQSVKAQPEKKHGFIAHKAIVENHTEELQALGVICGHFGNLVGLDARFKRDSGGLDVLHILGSPEVPQWTTEEHTKLLFGMTDAPHDFTRNDDGTFQDANVQAVYDAGVKSELMQAFGRAGLVLHPTTVVLWTAHDLPSVTHRNQTRLFDENDWDHADGNLDALPKAIAQREAREAAEAEAVEQGDVKATAEAKGITERHARRLTTDTRDAKREADRQRVFELHQQGMTQRAIERDTGFSRRKITKLLNEYKAVQNGHGHIELLNADVRNAPPEKSVVNQVVNPPINPPLDTPIDTIAGLLHFYIPEERSIDLSEIPPNEIQG